MRRAILEAATQLTAAQEVHWTAHFACGATVEGEAIWRDGRATLPLDLACSHGVLVGARKAVHALRGFTVGD